MIVLRRAFGKFFASCLVGPLLYLVAFGWGVGRNIQINGISYLEFIVPGIIALSAMNTSFSAVGNNLHISRLYHKTLDEYLIAPLSTGAFVLGKVLAGCVRGLIASLIILGLAFLFGAQLVVNCWFYLVVLLTCFLFGALGALAAMVVNSHEDMASFFTFVLLPMSFLCGTFFSPDRLPKVFVYIIEVLPLTHASYLLRAIASGHGIQPLSLAVLVVYAAVFFAVGVAAVRKVR
ncbi:MAG: ABC transporter permease [Pelotomaculum sp.]|uniref:Transport permease protein n=1 Tax=Pelotomaculum thermopropionicum (strain DSM 13744 / JCM 10971 / SI) TaxID=370438 RepID=A5D287_PELTS|nr:ABC transporter permease [Pelotomaculum sp.]BAF59656.1 ABC-type multidrug transport system, permease component [Pelotomaculum thermopropionicum SI]